MWTWDVHGTGVALSSELGLPCAAEYALRRHARAGTAVQSPIQIAVRAARFPEEARPPGLPLYLVRELPVEGGYDAAGYWLRAGVGGVVGDLRAHSAAIYAPDAAWLARPTFVRT